MNELFAFLVIATVAFFPLHRFWARQASSYEEIKRRQHFGQKAVDKIAVFWLVIFFLLAIRSAGLLSI